MAYILRPLSRRLFVTALGATVTTLTLPELLTGKATAQPAAQRVRADLATPTGRKNLALYALGIERMQARSRNARTRHHPHGWEFQANIHDYPGSEQISQIFSVRGVNDPTQRETIERHHRWAMGESRRTNPNHSDLDPGRVWATCSHHMPHQGHFLSWHRAYLFYLERIIEAEVGEPFAMPYWNYRADVPESLLLPADFQIEARARLPDDIRQRLAPNGTGNPLFYPFRKDEFRETGTGGQVGVGGILADIASFADANRARRLLDTTEAGFQNLLEGTPHGQIHAAIGTETETGVRGMAGFEEAARDPIFWMHHTNIDRGWERWRQPLTDGMSLRDPQEWVDREFTFIDQNLEQTSVTFRRLQGLIGQLGISYDDAETGTSPPVAMAAGGETPKPPPTTLSRSVPSGGAINVRKGETARIGIAPAVAPAVALGFGEKASTRYTLVVEAEVPKPSGAVFSVILRVPKSGGGSEDKVVGTFSFFGAGHGGGHAGHRGPISQTFRANITQLVRDKLVDPAQPGEVILRAAYAGAQITTRSVRIEAR